MADSGLSAGGNVYYEGRGLPYGDPSAAPSLEYGEQGHREVHAAVTPGSSWDPGFTYCAEDPARGRSQPPA